MQGGQSCSQASRCSPGFLKTLLHSDHTKLLVRATCLCVCLCFPSLPTSVSSFSIFFKDFAALRPYKAASKGNLPMSVSLCLCFPSLPTSVSSFSIYLKTLLHSDHTKLLVRATCLRVCLCFPSLPTNVSLFSISAYECVFDFRLCPTSASSFSISPFLFLGLRFVVWLRAVLCAALSCFRSVQHFFSPVQGSAGCSIVVVLFCTAFFSPAEGSALCSIVVLSSCASSL